MKPFPDQPLALDEHGTLRFQQNAIVRYLLDVGPMDMNKLAFTPFSNDDRAQFAQLIGYSLSGYSELSYVSDALYERAATCAPGGFGDVPEPRKLTHQEELLAAIADIERGVVYLQSLMAKDET